MVAVLSLRLFARLGIENLALRTFVAMLLAFALPPDQARAILQRVGATYVVTCGERAPPALSQDERNASLWGRGKTGKSSTSIASSRRRQPPEPDRSGEG